MPQSARLSPGAIVQQAVAQLPGRPTFPSHWPTAPPARAYYHPADSGSEFQIELTGDRVADPHWIVRHVLTVRGGSGGGGGGLGMGEGGVGTAPRCGLGSTSPRVS